MPMRATHMDMTHKSPGRVRFKTERYRRTSVVKSSSRFARLVITRSFGHVDIQSSKVCFSQLPGHAVDPANASLA